MAMFVLEAISVMQWAMLDDLTRRSLYKIVHNVFMVLELRLD